ncbi:CPBP family intramembrane glutamic endopeptidase [Halorarius halobius]|uniref:CPBP family intramembrane glutamic endopeptidase n=1 Tax=Halorarius halobius TaxID=2962671 RepID=UPI0020CCC455|nr:type II CAAX endopeptidase family protein [Halorarius halobius]
MSNVDTRRAGLVRPVAELVGLTIVAFLISVVAGVAFIVPMLVLGYGIETTIVLIGSTAAGQVAFLVVGYAYCRLRGVSVTIARPSGRQLLVVLGGTVAALVVATVLSVLLTVLDLLPQSVIGDIATRNPTFLLGLAALSVVLVAPAEEWLFRGVIQGRLRQRVGPVPAIAGSSLLFGSMHLANYSGALLPVFAGAALIVVVGCVFGALYEYTGNLTVPIVTHATYNVVLMGLSYLSI